MICCLNPDCPNPLNPDGTHLCLSCETPLIPLLRNRYRVIKPLGGGGFGRTYVIQDLDKLSELCVLKQLAPQVQGSWARQKAVELFEQEAKRLQQLGKQNQTPTLYAYFQEENYLYLVQEFIPGQNLLEELQEQGVFDEKKIRELLSSLLPLIQLIHEQNIIHRDIKPENIIRRQSDGLLFLIDFGVAKQITTTMMAKPGTTIGSFGYAPMEQIQNGEAFPASDLYGLGATCFHLLTDIHPWELWKQQGYGWSSSWEQQLTQPLSAPLKLILDKLLEINYLQRYQSASQVLDELRHLPTLIPEPTPSPRDPLPPTFQAVLAGSGSWLLAFLLSVVGTIWLSSRLWWVILGSIIWLLILGGAIFARSQPIVAKIYLFLISLITTLITYWVFQSVKRGNPFPSGFKGLIFTLLLIILSALLAYILIFLTKFVNKFISQYF